MHVRVFHNKNERESFLRGYDPADPLALVYAGDQDVRHPDDVYNACQHGVGSQRPWYQGRRSMSVGDVMSIDDTYFAVERVGFKEIERPRVF